MDDYTETEKKSPHIDIMGKWLLIHAGIKVNTC